METTTTDLVHYNAAPESQDELADKPAGDGGNLFKQVHRLLRGRYKLAAIVSGVCLVIGAIGGFLSGDLVYRSQGLVRIAPDTPRVIYQTEQNSQPPMFDSFVDQQITVMQSRQVIEQALAAPMWRELGDRAKSVSVDALRAGLIVKRATDPNEMPKPTLIDVSLDNANPDIAGIGLATILDAYLALYNGQVSKEDSRRVTLIEERLRELYAQQETLRQQIIAAGDGANGDALSAVYSTKVGEMNKVAERIAASELALKLVTEAGADPKEQINVEDVLLRQLASQNPAVAALITQRRDAARALDDILKRMGPNAPDAVKQRTQVSWLDQRIREFTTTPANVPLLTAVGSEGGTPPVFTAEGLRAQIPRDKQLLQSLRAEAAELSKRVADARALEAQSTAVTKRIEEARTRIDQLNVERDASQRITAISKGDRPGWLYKDNKRKRAILGAGVGVFLGLGVVLLLGALDERMLRPDVATIDAGESPLLGTIPDVPTQPGEAQPRDLTALSIHQIRALLEIGAAHHDRKAFAITSPEEGSGKTSLTIGLASSLALAGTRTLLVDCDLSSRVLRDGASDNAESTGKKSQTLDHVMVDMGFVDKDQIDPDMFPREDSTVGLLGMFAGQPLDQAVVHTNITGLSVLPALSAQASDIGRLSGQFVRKLIAQARREFDVILFDTGPIPGSVEALVVASEVDAVVLVVSRGELQSRFNKALSYLKLVGATVAGTVFNRAESRDLQIKSPGGAQQPKEPQRRWPIKKLDFAKPPVRNNNAGSGLFAAAVREQANTPSLGRPSTDDASPRSNDAAAKTVDAPISAADTGMDLLNEAFGPAVDSGTTAAAKHGVDEAKTVSKPTHEVDTDAPLKRHTPVRTDKPSGSGLLEISLLDDESASATEGELSVDMVNAMLACTVVDRAPKVVEDTTISHSDAAAMPDEECYTFVAGPWSVERK